MGTRLKLGEMLVAKGLVERRRSSTLRSPSSGVGASASA